MAVQRTHPRKRGADEDPGTRKYERNGRALHVKPCPVGGFYSDKGICRRQDPTEREGKREECGYRDQARFCAARAGDKADQDAGNDLHEVRRPDGKRDERKHDGERAPERRGKAEPPDTDAPPRALPRKI